MFAQWFPHTFVELQNHNIDHGADENVSGNFKTDMSIVEALFRIAQELDLPVVAGQDSHYADQREKKAHCVVGETTVTGLGPNNGRTVEWYYNMLHGAVDAKPGECEACGCDLLSDPKKNVYRTRDKSGTFTKTPNGKWYAVISIDGVRHQSKVGTRGEAEAWLGVMKEQIEDRWLCKSCYHTRYMFTRNGGTNIVGRDENGMLSLQKMIDVVYNGERHVMTIKTENGKSITSTPNHRHLTVSGWKRADRITTDDELVTYKKVTGRAPAWTNPIGTVASRVSSVQRHIRPERVYDVVMDSKDHSWLGNEVVTHNSLMKRMTYGGADDEFPGDSFHLASADWVAEHYPKDIWAEVEKGHELLLSLNDVKITPLDTFTPDVPSISKTPKRNLRRLVQAGFEDFLKSGQIKHSKEKTYQDRIEYELGIINGIGMAEYFLIVRDYVEWCAGENICIEARGSANGSLVCYLLGITQVDPLVWDIGFDRFLSTDRIKPPDIDMDIEDNRRQDLVQYLLKKYRAVQIGTWGKMGSRYDEREDKEVGSILVSWQSAKRRECEEEAVRAYEERQQSTNRQGTKADAIAWGKRLYAKRYGWVKDIRDVEKVSGKDYAALQEISRMNSVYRSYGVHAGGILLSGTNVKIEDYIPTMLVASSDTRVSQYDMNDVEEFGLLKMDILGQATLRTMKLAQELIGADDPTYFGWIPNDDADACKILREGRTENGIFHFEGYTKAKGGREMGIRTTKDAVLASALYMPGAMESGQTAHFVRARRDPDFRREITYLHPIFERHLKDTYGAYVFQNQVMSILHDMGMDISSINVFLKVVKDSGAGARERNADRLAGLKKTFDALWKKHGIDPNAREETWEALCGFGAYGFNKAHAAGYGIRSYRCAYLKAHYPAEFMTALLQTWAGRTKEKVYIREARRLGIRLMPPDVNVSGALWTYDAKRGAIRKGLLSIAGIGAAAADTIADFQPFTSLTDMATRLPARAVSGGKDWLDNNNISGKFAALEAAGALDSIPKE
jgi:DNA polymerase-3 subunit alpha